MKKLLVAMCLIVVISPKLAFCEPPKDKLTPRAPKAEIWDKFDIAYKIILIGGLLVGYRSGIATGIESEHRKMKNDTSMSRADSKIMIAQAKSIFQKPISFYVQQADDFLQKNPICKEMQVTTLLEQLVHVWASVPLKEHMNYKFIKERDYKDIEEFCSEQIH